MTKRILEAWETNHLLKYDINPLEIDNYGDMPVEYITGYAYFLGRDFHVNQNTLIPRIETGELVNLVRNFILQKYTKDANLTVADIGTGSGCIGISLLEDLSLKYPHLKCILSDKSPEALSIAQKNINELVEEKNQIRLIKSDLLLDYPDSLDIDVIVANLPYIPSERVSTLDDSVRKYEPHTALDGKDPKGLAIITDLLHQASKRISRPKAIFLEIDEYVKKEDLPSIELYSTSIKKDGFDKNRFAIYLLEK